MVLKFLHISFPQVLIFTSLIVGLEKIVSFSTVAKNNY